MSLSNDAPNTPKTSKRKPPSPLAFPPAVLRPAQAAQYVGLSVPTLARMRVDGTGPEFVQLAGRGIGYTRAALDAYVASRPAYRSTSQRTAALGTAA